MASRLVQTYGASSGRGSERFFTMVGQKADFPTFCNESKSLQSILTRKVEVATTNLLQYVPTAPETLLLFFLVLHT